jgi:peptidoglycan/LPS O-acetylase OafA/YrhL
MKSRGVKLNPVEGDRVSAGGTMRTVIGRSVRRGDSDFGCHVAGAGTITAPMENENPDRVPDAVAPPSGNPRFPAVDGLRAMAALSVVIFHADQFSGAGGILGRLCGHLDVGVAVFFAITGFLLYRPYFASAMSNVPRVPVRVFYVRRVLRIVPAYWLALIALSPLLTYARPLGLPNVLFLQIYRPDWSRTGIPPGWSVCVEMSFYLLLPVYALLLNRWWGHLGREARRNAELRLLAAMAVVSICLRILVHREVHSVFMVDPIPTTFGWFAGGMALAVISVEPGKVGGYAVAIVRKYPWAVWAAALFCYALTIGTVGEIETESVFIFVDYGAIALLVLAPFVLGEASFGGARFAVTRPVAWLGLVSYGIYLYHYPFIQEIHRIYPDGSPSLKLVVYAAFSIAAAVMCAALSYYIVERPALKLKRLTELRLPWRSQ